MRLTISGKHVEITEAIRSHVQEKIDKLPRYFNIINQVEVIIEGKNGGTPTVEIIARGEHSNVFIATESGEDTYRCIDMAVHKIERQLRREKGKQRNNKHIPGSMELEVESAEENEQADVA